MKNSERQKRAPPTKGHLLNIRSIRPDKCCQVVNSQIEYQFGFSRNVLLLASPLFIYASSCFSQPLACCRHNVTNFASVNEFRQLCNCFAPSCLTATFLGFSMMSCTLEFLMSNLQALFPAAATGNSDYCSRVVILPCLRHHLKVQISLCKLNFRMNFCTVPDFWLMQFVFSDASATKRKHNVKEILQICHLEMGKLLV